ncbi:MAG: hypothetical protein K2Y22_10275 [Candidatus Obscuribacterales bacterium]|nr:hypothetical protein [Candidatus Obscuribacterales bacterium]
MAIEVNAAKTDWQDLYKSRLTSLEDAVKKVSSGNSVYIHSNAAAPLGLINAMVARADELSNVEIYHLLTLGQADYSLPKYAKSFKVHALFIGPNVRGAVNAGIADYTPVFLSEIPALFLTKALPVDVCLLQVSPPDSHGYVSYGVSVDCTIAARKSAKVVIAEVNKQMPRTLGRSFLHISRIDHIVEVDRPLPELSVEPTTEVEESIGKFVASLVDDEATLQLGIGAIPNAVLKYLHGKKNLGVHSEMVSDGILDLLDAGVITNDAKTVLPGKTAVSFAMGTKRLYDYLDNNPSVEFQTSDYINDPFIIAKNSKMTSINSALQVDLTGQVSADSIGTNLYSGFGGQVDFVRGAARSKGGKAIIALPSTAKNGSVSRITMYLTKGSGVVTSRADVHYIVTEFGVAELHGKNLRDRAKALIAIAHPEHREALKKEASQLSWLNGSLI